MRLLLFLDTVNLLGHYIDQLLVDILVSLCINIEHSEREAAAIEIVLEIPIGHFEQHILKVLSQ